MEEKIKSNLVSGVISSNTKSAHDLYEKSRFGEKSNEKIVYINSEALYLVNKKKMIIFDSKGKEIGKEELVKKLIKIDKNFLNKYLVFQDLRDKGYILKSALKFGSDYRVYDKGEKVDDKHSKWILFITQENESIKWHELTSKSRVANSTKKKLLLAIVDGEEKISYYEVNWTKT